MMQRIRVVIVDDSVHACDGLPAFLITLPDADIIGEVTNGEEARRRVAAEQCGAV